MADILAIQNLYGANPDGTRAGDTVYGFNSTETDVNDWSQFVFVSGSNTFLRPPSMAIYDTGGEDTIDLSGFSTDQRLDLNPETFSSLGDRSTEDPVYENVISIMRGTIIENAFGGSGADTIIGNLADNTLAGGLGADNLTGGQGADIFVYYAAEEIVGDIVVDFTLGDTIVFRGSTELWSADLVWIDEAAFSQVAGEARFALVDGGTIVELDSDGDGVSDAVLLLTDYYDGLTGSLDDSGRLSIVSDSPITGAEAADKLVVSEDLGSDAESEPDAAEVAEVIDLGAAFHKALAGYIDDFQSGLDVAVSEAFIAPRGYEGLAPVTFDSKVPIQELGLQRDPDTLDTPSLRDLMHVDIQLDLNGNWVIDDLGIDEINWDGI